jgi:DNA-binding CsgD family transcriptional regulator
MEIRYFWLDALRQVAGASDAVANNLRYDPARECLRLTDVVAAGERTQLWTEMLQGASVQGLGVRAEHFTGMNTWGCSVLEQESTTVQQDVWAPIAAHSRIALNATEGDFFVGHVALLRTGDSPRFTEKDVRRLSAWRASTISLLSTTRSMTRTLDEAGPVALVFSASAEVLFRQDSSPGSLVHGVVEFIRPIVVRFINAGTCLSSEVTVGEFHCRLTRLTDGADHAVLVTCQPLKAPRVSAFSMLSPSQRVVAAYAARGETLQDIAGRLGRSAETVKSHLRQVYLRLEISSRAELAAMYEHALRWTTD